VLPERSNLSWVSPRRILVVGGGIGGLTAAIALWRYEWRPVVFDAAEALHGPDVPIVLWPKAMRALNKVGLATGVRSRARELEVVEIGGADGSVWLRVPFEQAGIRRVLPRAVQLGKLVETAPPEANDETAEGAARAVYRPVILSRRELHRLLAETAIRMIGAEALRMGQELQRLDQREQDVLAVFADATESVGAAVIGADGALSATRRLAFGEASLRRFGSTVFRGIVPVCPDSVRPGRFAEFHGTRGRIAFARLADGAAALEAVVFGGVDPESPAPQVLAEHFGGFAEPIPSLIASARDAIFERVDSADLPPPSKLAQHRVALIGDAAHPMLPDLWQGPSQAIEDAVTLGRSFARERDAEEAVKRYERRRLEIVRAAVRESRQSATRRSYGTALGLWVRRMLLAGTRPERFRALLAR
jgi:2-polyprenyl-6-methoxyphenol hydroxylase-like FAD-dependent oxidoreductase